MSDSFLATLGQLAQFADSLESENEGNVYEKGYSTAQRWGAVLNVQCNFKDTKEHYKKQFLILTFQLKNTLHGL
jgi:hypothetical protein